MQKSPITKILLLYNHINTNHTHRSTWSGHKNCPRQLDLTKQQNHKTNIESHKTRTHTHAHLWFTQLCLCPNRHIQPKDKKLPSENRIKQIPEKSTSKSSICIKLYTYKMKSLSNTVLMNFRALYNQTYFTKMHLYIPLKWHCIIIILSNDIYIYILRLTFCS